MIRRGIIALVGSLVGLPLAAHVLFVMPSSFHVSNGERITIGLHNGDAFPESESPPSLDRLRDVTIHTVKLQYNVTNLRVDGSRAVGDARIPAKGTLVIAARTIPNFIELPADAFEKYLKEEGMAQVIEWRKERGESAKPGRELYSKYVKSLVRSGSGDDTFSKPVGFTIEFLPEKDPYSAKVGDRIPVRLLWKGKPAAGLMVEAAHDNGASGGGADGFRRPRAIVFECSGPLAVARHRDRALFCARESGLGKLLGVAHI
jgi:uncharacterized GH25 family protein